MIQWQWFDPSTSDTWTMVNNPKKSSDPRAGTVNLESLASGGPHTRTLASPQLTEWKFSGRVRLDTEEAELRDWCARSRELHITNHFNDTYVVVVSKLDIPEQAKGRRRVDYTVSAYVLEGPL